MDAKKHASSVHFPTSTIAGLNAHSARSNSLVRRSSFAYQRRNNIQLLVKGEAKFGNKGSDNEGQRGLVE